MLEDRPINDFEQELIEIIRKHSCGDPYKPIWINNLSKEELKSFDPGIIEEIIKKYLRQHEPDYVRLRWFIRRLAQVGHPAAIDILLREFAKLLPAISEICRYFLAASQVTENQWDSMGYNLLDFLNNEIVASNEYLQLSILSLFSSQERFNNLPGLLSLYRSSSSILNREIVLCAARHKAVAWLREQKEHYPTMDPWCRRAFLYAAHLFPMDEKKFFLRQTRPNGQLEEMVVQWAKTK